MTTVEYQAGPRSFNTLDEAIEYAERCDWAEVATVVDGKLTSVHPLDDTCSREIEMPEVVEEVIEVNEQETEQEFVYAPLNRPAFYGTAPEGFTVKSDEQTDALPYGTVSYTRKLTAQELYKWEMIPVSPNAYIYAVGSRVLVNDCDDATVTEHAPRGRYIVKFDCTGTTENVHIKQLEPLAD